MTTTEEFSSKVYSLKTRVGWLQDGAALKSARDAVEDTQSTVHGMKQRIADLRGRGYAFEKDLEEKAASFEKQWISLHPSIVSAINQQSNVLQASLRPLETQLGQLAARANNPASGQMLMQSVESSIDTLEDKVRAAEGTINGMYDTFARQVREVTGHLDEVDTLLKNLAEASFKLLNTEGGIISVKAVWCKNAKEQEDDPDGILYLTDQRLIFEQKEEIATKKILFITTEKKKVQELEWEVPIALIEKITPSKTGLMKNEDHLEILFSEGAPFDIIHLHIWKDNNEFIQLINRAKAKEFDKGRAIAIAAEEVEKVKSAPSQCPSCGANISQVILRGQDNITCEYCGFVIRL